MVTSASQLTPLADLINGRKVATPGALPAAGDFPGERIYIESTGEVATWNLLKTRWEGFWISFTPSWTNVTLGTTGLVNLGRYRIENGSISIIIQLTLGTGGSFTSGPALAMPGSLQLIAVGSMLPLGLTTMIDGGVSTTRRVGSAYQASQTSIQFLIADNAAGSQLVTNTTPWTWAPTDALNCRVIAAELA